MKRFLLIILLIATCLSLFGCSSDEESFHYDYINKYSIEKSGEYYMDTLEDVKIMDFGLKYRAELYDVEPTNDEELCYYYIYEGAKERDKAWNDIADYLQYLDGIEELERRGDDWYYTINGTKNNVIVTYYDKKEVGMLVAVIIPTKGIVGERHDSDIDVTKVSDTAVSESGN